MTAEVLIVGAGPTGLLLYLELVSRGIAARLVDAAAAQNEESRALQLGARTLRVLHDHGLAEAAIEAGHEVHGVNIYSGGERVAHVDFDDIDLPYPFHCVISQAQTERLLTAAIEKAGGKIERGLKVTAASQTEGGVTVRAGDREIAARWLVGADGAASTVRELFGFDWEADKEQAFVVADCRLDLEQPRDEQHVFQATHGLVLVQPMPGAGHYRVVIDDPPKDTPEAPDRAFLEKVIDGRATGVGLDEVTWSRTLRRRPGRVVNRRLGRVFLAGDAAFAQGPLGDLGLNAGIADAQNLGWKLALVASGAAHPGILESYDIERRPPITNPRHVNDAVTRAVTLRHPVGREVRERIAGFLLSLDAVKKKLSLEQKYTRSPLSGESREPLRQAALVPDRTTEMASVRDWLDFGAAPGPGAQIPDAPIEGKRLCDLLRGGKHTLLLFDGAAQTALGYQNLRAIAAQARARVGGRLAVHIVVPGAERPADLPAEESVLLDDEQTLHRRFGAGAECLYLVRPDGYVGFRAQPASFAPLAEYLDLVFKASSP